MQSQDIYVRLTDPAGKRPSVINYHRVWDKQRFILAQKQIHEERAKGGDVRQVSIATEAEYVAQKQGARA
ncbi:hypothetical protein [Ectopseudomonas oleovorans]|uniref:Uncharacterized protein n=1 Tax=Ectopseudomonas oleovorans TaxID=301 RepID=A0A379K4Z1_ECTOL|nr:hypothetical protein [Pseudomonas oleovorans]MBN7118063.1 hypothetical protein [Pseudomonas oleovorans]MBN7131980.1 hypothetical protein [Pseudomonas oleovorans]MBN7141874.1 hypothetical protein [Pseudomonas oleovorans]SUD59770.1 Uncharacterised protein [Pseudomonas oleovorans]